MTTNTFKIVIIGEARVGKTSYVNALLKKEKKKTYVPTFGVSVEQIYAKMPSNDKTIFNIWDCAGSEKYRGLGDGYYIGAQAGIVMFDTSDVRTYLHIKKYIKNLYEVCGNNIPITIIGYKSDIKDINIKFDELIRYTPNNVKYFELSSDASDITALREPFIYLHTMLTKKHDLRSSSITL